MDRRDRYQRELLERQKAGVSPAEVGIYTRYVRFIKEKIDWQIESVETARKQVEAKKEELLAARKDRKTLDRLRSRRYQAFLADSRRKEMKHLDQVALGRFQGRTRERRG
jgi:flagellar FliJ protein